MLAAASASTTLWPTLRLRAASEVAASGMDLVRCLHQRQTRGSSRPEREKGEDQVKSEFTVRARFVFFSSTSSLLPFPCGPRRLLVRRVVARNRLLLLFFFSSFERISSSCFPFKLALPRRRTQREQQPRRARRGFDRRRCSIVFLSFHWRSRRRRCSCCRPLRLPRKGDRRGALRGGEPGVSRQIVDERGRRRRLGRRGRKSRGRRTAGGPHVAHLPSPQRNPGPAAAKDAPPRLQQPARVGVRGARRIDAAAAEAVGPRPLGGKYSLLS